MKGDWTGSGGLWWKSKVLPKAGFAIGNMMVLVLI